MKLSRPTAFMSLSLAILLVAGVFLINLRAQENKAEPPAATSGVTTVAADSDVESESETAATGENEFAVPEGSVAEKLAFIDKLTQPTTLFTSAEDANKYWSQAAMAMKTGADQVLGEKPTDAEASEAVQFKVEALRILAMLGDEDAERERTEFLDASLKDPRFAVSSVVGPLRMIPKMRRWQQLDDDQRNSAVDTFIADVKSAGPTPGQAELLIGFGDSLSDSPDRGLAARALDQLLPKFKSSKDSTIVRILPMLEGLNRRLHLPGNKLELEGTLINGRPFAWDAYRGKVVLIDFWASWCGECLKEVPNILQNYHDFHGKGFEVVGVCLDDELPMAEEAIRKYGMTWPQIVAEQSQTGEPTHPMAEKYAIIGIPRAILVDQQGNVVTMLARGPRLQAYLTKLLGPAEESDKPAGPQLGAPGKSDSAASES